MNAKGGRFAIASPVVILVVLVIFALLAASETACDRPARNHSAPARNAILPAVAPQDAGTDEIQVWDLARVQSELKKRHAKPFIVHIWASWCMPCVRELPELDAFVVRAASRGIPVISLALDKDFGAGGRIPSMLRARAPHLKPILALFDDGSSFTQLFARDWQGTIPALFGYQRGGVLHKALYDQLNPADLDQLLDQLASPPKSRPTTTDARAKDGQEADGPKN